MKLIDVNRINDNAGEPAWLGSAQEGRTMAQCVHGMDTRFCSLCNTPARDARRGAPRGAVGDVTLLEILTFLNDEHVRATHGAVAEVLGVSPRSIGALLGPRTAEASWIVESEMHPALLRDNEIITSGIALMLRLTTWKASRGGHS